MYRTDSSASNYSHTVGGESLPVQKWPPAMFSKVCRWSLYRKTSLVHMVSREHVRLLRNDTGDNFLLTDFFPSTVGPSVSPMPMPIAALGIAYAYYSSPGSSRWDSDTTMDPMDGSSTQLFVKWNNRPSFLSSVYFASTPGGQASSWFLASLATERQPGKVLD
jgi:hypothetical protein